MKTMKSFHTLSGIALAMTFTMAACTSDVQLPGEEPAARVMSFSATMATPSNNTRISHTEDGDDIITAWEVGDMVRAYNSTTGEYCGDFEILSADDITNDGKNAVFTGPAFAEDGEYRLLGPGDKFEATDNGHETQIDFTGQIPLEDPDHLKHLKDYTVIEGEVTVTGGAASSATFSYRTAIMEFNFSGLIPIYYSGFEITSSNPEGIATDFSAAGNSYGDTFQVDLEEAFVTGDFTIWIMMPASETEPTFKAGTLTFKVFYSTTSMGEDTVELDADKTYTPGKKYSVTLEME